MQLPAILSIAPFATWRSFFGRSLHCFLVAVSRELVASHTPVRVDPVPPDTRRIGLTALSSFRRVPILHAGMNGPISRAALSTEGFAARPDVASAKSDQFINPMAVYRVIWDIRKVVQPRHNLASWRNFVSISCND
jgi:hypothetical protein